MKSKITVRTRIRIVIVISVALPLYLVMQFFDKSKINFIGHTVVISGNVVDEENCNIKMAEVSIIGRTEKCTTDDRGLFILTMAIKQGEILLLQVASNGFEPALRYIQFPYSAPVIIILKKASGGITFENKLALLEHFPGK